MITITPNISYFDAKGIEQSINKKVMLIVGKEEKAVKVLDNTKGEKPKVYTRKQMQ